MKQPTLSDFRSHEFLVDRLLLANKLVWLVGFPGISKSLIVLEIAARLTRGKSPGTLKGDPSNVIYVSEEGAFETSIGPRFWAARGNFNRFEHVFEIIDLPGDADAGYDRLETLITKHKARLLILDPIKDHLNGGAYGSPTKAARALARLSQMAESKNCTILCVDWPSKSTKKDDFSVSGNQSFTGKPRQIITVGRLSQDEWVVGVTKANESDQWVGWIYAVIPAKVGTIVTRAIEWKRSAEGHEIRKARQQADLEENPNLRQLLQFMNEQWKVPKTEVDGTEIADREGNPVMTLMRDDDGAIVMAPFATKDLVNWLNNVRGIGQKKARALITTAGDAGYLASTVGGKGEDYAVTWRISPLGIMKLNANEEEAQEAIETFFPSMERRPPKSQTALNPAPDTTEEI